MRHVLRTLVCLLMTVSAVAIHSPAEARPGRPSAPWVIASTPHSMTVQLSAVSGAVRYRVAYSRSYKGAGSPSARTRSTSGRQTRLTVKGLRAGTTYCFAVQAVGRSSTSARSERHCHETQRRANNTKRPTASVVTFNICATASNCVKWSRARQNAIISKIAASKADVVALQESARHVDNLTPQLRARGYALAVETGDEAIFYRTSKFEFAETTVIRKICYHLPYEGTADTSTWEKLFHNEDGTPYVYVKGTWYRWGYGCPEAEMPWPLGGIDTLPHHKSLAYVGLKDVRSGKQFVVINTHLSNGRTARAVRERRDQIKAIQRGRNGWSDGLPTVLVGDFNSDRTRPSDPVGVAMGKSGFSDAYQRSASYKRPYLNSFNGYRRTPHRSTKWGGHIDRIFVPATFGVKSWEVVATLRHGRYTGRWASDHNPVRATLYLP